MSEPRAITPAADDRAGKAPTPTSSTANMIVKVQRAVADELRRPLAARRTIIIKAP